MPSILAIDQGTSSSRTIIFDLQGNIQAVAQKEFTQFYPQSGYVEHDPMEILSSQQQTMREAFEKSGLKLSEIVAIGITNQRETLVVWDRKTGKPLHKAIVWQDRRSSSLMETLRQEFPEEKLREKTGLPYDPYFTATKIRWLLEAFPEIRSKAKQGEVYFGTIDSWLIYNLTNKKRFVTDATNASRTLMMDIQKGDWDDELLALFGVSQNNLAEILPSNAFFGETDFFGSPLPIHGVAGDQQAALFGQLCFQKGEVKNTYGTGCFILAFTGEDCLMSKNKLLTTIAWQLENQATQYALEGGVFIGGAAVQWLRDGLKIIQSAPQINEIAQQVQDTEGVYFVPAFAGLGAPYWNPEARGTITGLTRGTNQAHLARATLESIALQSNDVIQAMSQDLNTEIKVIRVDGGASASDMLMQMQADFSNCKVIRPNTLETTALGSALLAGLGKGVFQSLEEMKDNIQLEREFVSKLETKKRDQKILGWKKAIQATNNCT